MMQSIGTGIADASHPNTYRQRPLPTMPRNSLLESQWLSRKVTSKEGHGGGSSSQVEHYRGRKADLFIKLIHCRVPGGVEALLKSGAGNVEGVEGPVVEEECTTTPVEPTTTMASSGGGSARQWGSRLLRAAKGTTDRIERGMATVAIRADRGKHPDWVCVGGRVVPSSSSGMSFPGRSLGVTESMALPGEDETVTTSTTAEELPVSFVLPLGLTEEDTRVRMGSSVGGGVGGRPYHHETAGVVPPNNVGYVQLTVLTRSGAGLVLPGKKRTGGVGKHYVVGTATVRIADLWSLQTTTTTVTSPKKVVVPLQSQVVVGGSIEVVVIPDDTHVPRHLTDPLPQYCDPFCAPFHPPLQQSYAFSPFSTTIERASESTVILPCATAVARLAAASCRTSVQYATEARTRVDGRRCAEGLDPVSTNAPTTPRAACLLEVKEYRRAGGAPPTSSNACSVKLRLRSPACGVLEQDLGMAGGVPIHPSFGGGPTLPFYPPLTTTTTMMSSTVVNTPVTVVGALRLVLVTDASPTLPLPGGPPGLIGVDHLAMPSSSSMANHRPPEGMLDMDPYVGRPDLHGISHELAIPIYEGTHNNNLVGHLHVVFSIHVSLPSSVSQPLPTPTVSSSTSVVTMGLVELVGLARLTNEEVCLDLDHLPPCPPTTATATTHNDNDNERRLRQQRMAAMGDFVSTSWLSTHWERRTEAQTTLEELAGRYGSAIASVTPPPRDRDPWMLPHEQKEHPMAFRPSSSKLTPVLACVPMNVHVQSYRTTTATSTHSAFAGLDHEIRHVTCGACADHAAKFRRGGLRRMENRRKELAVTLTKQKAHMVDAVMGWMRQQQQQQQQQQTPQTQYVPLPDLPHLLAVRKACVEAEQALIEATWDCAVRRVHVLSHAIGIAVTSYLSSLTLSQPNNVQQPQQQQQQLQKYDQWIRHGYLLTFSGLLSAVGKELGMIEDTVVAIQMLHDRVAVQLVPAQQNIVGAVPVHGSAHLRWISVDAVPIPSTTTVGRNSYILVRVGMDPALIPSPLATGAIVRIRAVLFEMGVDIHQWGVNTSHGAVRRLTTNIHKLPVNLPANVKNFGGLAAFLKDDEEDDDEDFARDGSETDVDVDVDIDGDILSSINNHSLQLLNRYATEACPHELHSSSLPPPDNGFLVSTDAPTTPAITKQPQPQIHPRLVELEAAVVASAGIIHPRVVDAAADATTALWGSNVIFCKSGKDRTGVQVTSRQARGDPDIANVLRGHGTRLGVCEKNVGLPKYAFNSLQNKFLPESLRPPPHTLAGFLKGGQVFSGKGFVES